MFIVLSISMVVHWVIHSTWVSMMRLTGLFYNHTRHLAISKVVL